MQAPCLPCSKLGVKRGHCATIPLSLSIAAVEAEYVVAIEAGEATLRRLLLLFLVYEVAQRPWPLFLCSFPAKKGVHDDTFAADGLRGRGGRRRSWPLEAIICSYPWQSDSIISKVGLPM